MSSAIADEPKAVFLATMAREMHRAGIATDELETTLSSIASAIDLPAQIFALPTYITIAVGPDWRQQIALMRLPPGTVNLRRIALLNLIYADVRRGAIDYQEAIARIERLDRTWPGFSPLWQIPALLLVATGVAVVLGGGLREQIVAGGIGLVTGVLSAITRRFPVIAHLYEVLASFSSTLVFALFDHLFGSANVFISIIAGVVVVLPGYSLTLALSELANGNLVAGVARLGKVFSTLLALGCGALLGFAIVGPSLLEGANVQTEPVPFAGWVIAAILMSVGFSINLDARARDFVWVFASSVVALGTSHLLAMTPVHVVNAFVSAFVCGIVASLGARLLRIPQPVMLVPALLVLVPGSLSYESILFAFHSNINTALASAVNAVSQAVLIVAGLLLSQILLPTSPLRVTRKIQNVPS